MSVERPCDCDDRHMRFPDRDPAALTYELLHPPIRPHLPRPIPVMHQHEDERCSERYLGMGGCPGLPHCRDWIIGTHNAGIAMADVQGDRLDALLRRIHRNRLKVEFARRPPLAAPR